MLRFCLLYDFFLNCFSPTGKHIFSVFLLIAGLVTVIVGGLARSLRDIILGCVAVVAVFSTPFFAQIFHANRSGPIDTALRVLTGWAGVGYILLSGFAALAIIPTLHALRRENRPKDIKKNEDFG